MTPSEEDPITLPKRTAPTLQLATARQLSDGTVVEDGPRPFTNHEILQPARWAKDMPGSGREATIAAAVQPLRNLSPSCPGAADFAVRRLLRRAANFDDRKPTDVLTVVRAPGLQIDTLASALASAFFRDGNAFEVFDCKVEENSSDGLFGTPPGYSGHLDGGKATNRLARRPETIVVLDNIECADAGTLARLRSLARDGTCREIARGGVLRVIGGDDAAVFVMSTERGFTKVAERIAANQPAAETFRASLKAARPDLRESWDGFLEEAFVYAPLCLWGNLP